MQQRATNRRINRLQTILEARAHNPVQFYNPMEETPTGATTGARGVLSIPRVPTDAWPAFADDVITTIKLDIGDDE